MRVRSAGMTLLVPFAMRPESRFTLATGLSSHFRSVPDESPAPGIQRTGRRSDLCGNGCVPAAVAGALCDVLRSLQDQQEGEA